MLLRRYKEEEQKDVQYQETTNLNEEFATMENPMAEMKMQNEANVVNQEQNMEQMMVKNDVENKSTNKKTNDSK